MDQKSMDNKTQSKQVVTDRPTAGLPLKLKRSISTRRTVVALLTFIIATAVIIFFLWDRGDTLPAGLVSSNGRIEADEVNIAAKFAGRVKEIVVREGDLVKPGQVLALMDTAELDAMIEKARAEVSRSESEVVEADATVDQRKAQLTLTNQELERTLTLFERGHVSKGVLDERQSRYDSARAALAAAQAHLKTAQRTVEVEKAEVKRIQTEINEAILKAPVMGRVLYRLAEPGEVLAAGGKVLTLLNLGEVYMEVFLPSREAGRIALGSDARIVLDPVPHFAIPATVTFVSPQAQFTPKQVETAEEREKLMFRVKVKVPTELVERHIEKVKTGVRGVAFLRLSGIEPPPWPDYLERRPPEETK
ncbi:MAG: HlyD family efflux transporter periplasmic adaptor subunit [Methyloceanibacter sp.]